MDKTICSAIKAKKMISFNYKGYPRVVEPHAHGISTAGNYCLRCYQVSGGSSSGKVPGWKIMTTDQINGISVSQERFAQPRDGYKKGDKAMSIIFCEL